MSFLVKAKGIYGRQIREIKTKKELKRERDGEREKEKNKERD
jgi:hypothetical protein